MDTMIEHLKQHQAALDAQAAAEQAERDRLNSEARARHLAALAAQRQAKADEWAAAQEQAFADDKARLQREWQAAHPEYRADPQAFDRLAWPLLRQNLIADRDAAVLEATKRQLRQRGGYSL